MTTELTQAPPEQGTGAAPAGDPGQGQGHRRRRRRRKNKPSQPATAQQPAAQATPAAPAAPAAAPAPAPAQPKRTAPAKGQVRKKKFTPRSAAPGGANAASSQPQSQPKPRKMVKQRTPRQFVGPMDHSYRTVNGNIDDGPPSTIQISSGEGRQNHNMESFTTPAPAPVREDAPTRIYCFVEDLFFTAKIQETARKQGVKVEFIKGGAKEDIARLIEMPEEQRPKLLVFDLNNANAKPIATIPKLKSKLKKATSIVGFLNHLQGELKAKAVEAGCDTVMPRSAFSQGLPNLLRRYGLEDEDDHYRQPV